SLLHPTIPVQRILLHELCQQQSFHGTHRRRSALLCLGTHVRAPRSALISDPYQQRVSVIPGDPFRVVDWIYLRAGILRFTKTASFCLNSLTVLDLSELRLCLEAFAPSP